MEFETTLHTTKVKAKSCLFILYLCCQQYFLETSGSASIKKSDVAKYLIQRELGSAVDIFSVLLQQGCHQDRCNPENMRNFCANLSADSTASPENFTCSCSCKYTSKTFLPEKGECLPDNQIANNLKDVQTQSGVGCSKNLLSWGQLFLSGFDLRTNGTEKHYLSANFESCEVIPGSPMYYDSLEERWKRICSEIFTVRFQKDNGIILKWEADKKNMLSGRILRLMVTCNYTTNKPPLNGCLLFKAVGTVIYDYTNQSVVQESGCPSSTISSLVSTESTLHVSTSVTSSLLSSPPSILPSPPSLSSSWSSLSAVTTTVQGSLKTPTASLATSSFFPWQSQNSQPSDQSKIADSKVVSPSKPETRNTMSFSSSEGLSKTVVSTTILRPAIKTNVFSVHPSKPSLATEAASSSAVIDRPGKKKAIVNGSDNNGVVIGATVGGAAVCGIFIIIIVVLCKKRKLWRNKEKTTRLQVKNPVYGSSDIPLSSATENQVTTSRDQDSQPTYEDLITDSGGKINEAALYSSPENDNYDNCNVYQSLDKKVPQSPVYQSLTKGQLATGKPNPKPKPSATRPPSERPEVTAEPVYNVLKQHDTEHGSMPEKANEVPEHDSYGDTQDPLYNVLEGSDADENYEAPNVDDSLYNVLEEPESKQDPQEPLYNVLESSDSEKSSHQEAHGSSGLSNEPLYNLLEGPGSDGPNKNGVGYAASNGSSSPDAHDNPAYEQSLDFGPNKNGVGYAAPNGSSSPDAHDNPAYEQSLDFDVPYTSVHRPGSQRESVYEPLRGPDDQDLYEPLK